MTISDWVPEACTLPTADQPLRLAEFDDLFTTALRAITRTSPTTLELVLDAVAEETAADLTTRETACCSFFTFTYTPTADGQLHLETTVPPAHTAVLDALAARATALSTF
ncbi:hypothetical protein AB0L70_37815 [Kribbella sp. NPDC051952]|uniref:hypothetical protein n=1 Tax=Kribbella sp. NPDC051952 TaxID=3154851 RepID=UPI003414CE58